MLCEELPYAFCQLPAALRRSLFQLLGQLLEMAEAQWKVDRDAEQRPAGMVCCFDNQHQLESTVSTLPAGYSTKCG